MWQKLGPIAEGGTVFSIAVNHNQQIWLSTGAGILRQTPEGWQPIPQNRPLPAVGALQGASTGQTWWAAGLSGGLARSRDGGHSWEASWIDQVAEPVTCLAISPQDNDTLLAGTGGAGLLRSVDRGRRWLLSNFGLRDFTILALTTATDWSRREYVFAGTLAGVYRSSNGGRAWKPAGLADMTIQALATSATFAENGLVLAGTEGDGLHRSTDGGRSWEAVEAALPPDSIINALLSYCYDGQEYWLAATDEGSLWRSEDGGRRWSQVLEGADPVQALASTGQALYAGLSEGGLLISTDGGQSWQRTPAFCGRGFQRLVTGHDGRLLALAPNEGGWISTDGGQTWRWQIIASFGRPLFDLLLLDPAWLGVWLDGIWRSQDQGQAWEPVLAPAEGQIVALARPRTTDGPLWAIAANSHAWRSTDTGLTWQAASLPFAGQQLLSWLLPAAEKPPLFAVQQQAGQRLELTLWRAGETGWQPWFNRPLRYAFARLAGTTDPAGPIWLAFDRELWQATGDDWQKIHDFDGQTRQLLVDPTSQAVYVLVENTVFHSRDGHTWDSLPPPPAAPHLIDLQLDPTGHLLALDAAGSLWRTRF